MGAKAANLNSVVENQDSDFNLESAVSHTMTCRMLHAFKTDLAAISHHCKGIARPKICAEGGDVYLRIDWFNEMRIESCLVRAAYVFLGAETSNCNCLDRPF